MDDPFDTPEGREWRQHVNHKLRPMIEDSGSCIALFPQGEPDAKMAVELGFMVLLDKPIVLVVPPGAQVPEKLVKVADVIVDGDITQPGVAERIAIAAQTVSES